MEVTDVPVIRDLVFAIDQPQTGAVRRHEATHSTPRGRRRRRDEEDDEGNGPRIFARGQRADGEEAETRRDRLYDLKRMT